MRGEFVLLFEPIICLNTLLSTYFGALILIFECINKFLFDVVIVEIFRIVSRFKVNSSGIFSDVSVSDARNNLLHYLLCLKILKRLI